MNDINPKHEWDLLSNYCIHCGMSAVHQLDAPQKCHRELNITAISHIVSSHRLGELVNGIRTSFKNRNSDS